MDSPSGDSANLVADNKQDGTVENGDERKEVGDAKGVKVDGDVEAVKEFEGKEDVKNVDKDKITSEGRSENVKGEDSENVNGEESENIKGENVKGEDNEKQNDDKRVCTEEESKNCGKDLPKNDGTKNTNNMQEEISNKDDVLKKEGEVHKENVHEKKEDSPEEKDKKILEEKDKKMDDQVKKDNVKLNKDDEENLVEKTLEEKDEKNNDGKIKKDNVNEEDTGRSKKKMVEEKDKKMDGVKVKKENVKVIKDEKINKPATSPTDAGVNKEIKIKQKEEIEKLEKGSETEERKTDKEKQNKVNKREERVKDKKKIVKSTQKEQTKGGDVTNASQGDVTVQSKSSSPTEARLTLSQAEKKLEKERVFKLKKKNLKFPNAKYFCRICLYHCDNIPACNKHINDQKHIKVLKGIKVDEAIKNMKPPDPAHLDLLTQLLLSTAEQDAMSEKDMETRREVVDRMSAAFKEKMPGVDLRLFGSSVSGLGFKQSDLNVELILPVDSKEEHRIAKALVDASSVMKDCNTLFSSVKPNFESKFPCIDFVESKSGLSGKISIMNNHAYNTNNLLYNYSQLDSRVKPLAIGLRKLARLCKIDIQSDGSIPSYAFNLMTIFYLQQADNPILPVLDETLLLKESEATKDKPKEENFTSKNTQSVGELWLCMLKFFSVEYPIEEEVICIRKKASTTREEMRISKKRLAIEDPYNTSKRNVAKSLASPTIFKYVMDRFKSAYLYFATPRYNKQIDISQSESKEVGKVESALPVSADNLKNVSGTNVTMNEQPTADIQTADLNSKVDDVPEEIKQFGREIIERAVKICEADARRAEGQTEAQVEVEDCKKNGALRDEDDSEEKKDAAKDLPDVVPGYLEFSFDVAKLTDGEQVQVFCSHCNKHGHSIRNCPEEDLPTPKPLPRMTKQYMKRIDALCTQIPLEFELKEPEHRSRDGIVSALQNHIKKNYPEAKLTLFGSSRNGFGFQGSDLDICMTMNTHEDASTLNVPCIIEDLGTILRKKRDLYNIFAITTAKVPIVKFVHRNSQLEGDISLYNTLAQYNTQMIKAYSSIDPRVKQLGFTIKAFAKNCMIGDASRGSLSSYAYTLMVLFYLQQCKPPVIPVLQEFNPNGERPVKIIDERNVWYFSDIKNLKAAWKDYGKNRFSVGELWLGLLRFYTEDFDFRRYVISIRQLKLLTKFEKLWSSRSIAIEDPFDLDHNLGGGVSRKMNSYIMLVFQKAREHFGTPRILPPNPNFHHDFNIFFNVDVLTDGNGPPDDRLCHLCGRVGHFVKECPRKRDRKTPNQRSGNQDDRFRQQEYNRSNQDNDRYRQDYNRSNQDNDRYRQDYNRSNSDPRQVDMNRRDYQQAKGYQRSVSLPSSAANKSGKTGEPRQMTVTVIPSQEGRNQQGRQTIGECWKEHKQENKTKPDEKLNVPKKTKEPETKQQPQMQPKSKNTAGGDKAKVTPTTPTFPTLGKAPLEVKPPEGQWAMGLPKGLGDHGKLDGKQGFKKPAAAIQPLIHQHPQSCHPRHGFPRPQNPAIPNVPFNRNPSSHHMSRMRNPNQIQQEVKVRPNFHGNQTTGQHPRGPRPPISGGYSQQMMRTPSPAHKGQTPEEKQKFLQMISQLSKEIEDQHKSSSEPAKVKPVATSQPEEAKVKPYWGDKSPPKTDHHPKPAKPVNQSPPRPAQPKKSPQQPQKKQHVIQQALTPGQANFIANFQQRQMAQHQQQQQQQQQQQNVLLQQQQQHMSAFQKQQTSAVVHSEAGGIEQSRFQHQQQTRQEQAGRADVNHLAQQQQLLHYSLLQQWQQHQQQHQPFPQQQQQTPQQQQQTGIQWETPKQTSPQQQWGSHTTDQRWNSTVQSQVYTNSNLQSQPVRIPAGNHPGISSPQTPPPSPQRSGGANTVSPSTYQQAGGISYDTSNLTPEQPSRTGTNLWQSNTRQSSVPWGEPTTDNRAPSGLDRLHQQPQTSRVTAWQQDLTQTNQSQTTSSLWLPREPTPPASPQSSQTQQQQPAQQTSFQQTVYDLPQLQGLRQDATTYSRPETYLFPSTPPRSTLASVQGFNEPFREMTALSGSPQNLHGFQTMSVTGSNEIGKTQPGYWESFTTPTSIVYTSQPWVNQHNSYVAYTGLEGQQVRNQALSRNPYPAQQHSYTTAAAATYYQNTGGYQAGQQDMQ